MRADRCVLCDDWKQAWKDEVQRAERAEAEVERLRDLLRTGAATIHEVEAMTFAEGDRVVRPADVFALRSPLLHGVVTRAYSEHGYPELYDVRWDNGDVGLGYLDHGLDEEAMNDH